jgi:hypothetical protein
MIILRTVVLILVTRQIVASTSNRFECGPNTAMDGGCHLLDYNGQWLTTKCANGFVMTVDSNCITPCPEGKYLFGGECKSCSLKCKRCAGPLDTDCSECLPGYSKNFQGICTYTCLLENRLYSLPPTSPTDTSTDVCLACDQTCGTCINKYETSCRSCQPTITGRATTLRILDYADGYTNSGYCVPNPPLAYSNYYRRYPGDNLLVQCPDGCASCIDSFRCTECLRTYSLYPPNDFRSSYALCYPEPTSG